MFQQKEGPTQQRQGVSEAYSSADPSSTGWALHCHSQATPQESTKTSRHLGLAGGGENWMLWPSLASPKCPILRILEQNLSTVNFLSFTSKMQCIGAISLSVTHSLVQEWNTPLTFHHIYQHKDSCRFFNMSMGAAEILFCLVWFSPPLAVIAEARWEGQVRNNMLALHNYFQHRHEAMNGDMDLALLQSLWFGLNCFHWPAVGGHCVLPLKCWFFDWQS